MDFKDGLKTYFLKWVSTASPTLHHLLQPHWPYRLPCVSDNFNLKYQTVSTPHGSHYLLKDWMGVGGVGGKTLDGM